MVKYGRVAHRYARAVFDSLKEEGKIRGVLSELSRFAKLVEDSRELNYMLNSKVFSFEKRKAVLEDVLKHLKTSDESRRVLLLLARVRRMHALSGIVDKLNQLLLDAANVIPLQVDAASDLSAEEKARIEKRFHEILGKKVAARYVVDPNLIGGLRVTAAGRTYDGSLAGWLSSFQEQSI